MELASMQLAVGQAMHAIGLLRKCQAQPDLR